MCTGQEKGCISHHQYNSVFQQLTIGKEVQCEYTKTTTKIDQRTETENPRGFKDHTWKDLESILKVGIKSKTEESDILAYLQVNM